MPPKVKPAAPSKKTAEKKKEKVIEVSTLVLPSKATMTFLWKIGIKYA